MQTKMQDWIDNARSQFLDELLWHEGLGSSTSPDLCYTCGENLGEHRCMDCMGSSRYCKRCIVALHSGLPLHRIEVRLLLIQLTVY